MAQTSNKLFFIICFLAALVTVTQALTLEMRKMADAGGYVDAINLAQDYWTASLNKHFALLDEEHIRRLLGGVKSYNETNQQQQNKTNHGPKRPIPNGVKLPKEFDARKKWPECADFIGMVTDQGNCRSCTSVSAASVLTDRFCIERLKKGIRTSTDDPSSYVSAQDTLESQHCTCGIGAHPKDIWHWFHINGAVSGTNFTTALGCKPYLIDGSKHRSKPDETLFCKKECDGQSPSGYRKGRVFDLRSGPTHLDGVDENRETDMMVEIYKNGPIQVSVLARAELLYYGKSIKRINVYVQTSVDGSLYNYKSYEKHAMKLIGWGQKKRGNGEIVKYWLGVNSWGTSWGEDGLFKWRRGTDENKIESESVDFGTPFV